MTRFAQVFWAIAALDAVALVVLLLMLLNDPHGQNDGGREMGLFFFIMLPALVLAAAMAMFRFGTSLPVRSIALFIVVVPAIWFAEVKIDERLIDRSIEADQRGIGYFDSEPMRRMGAAVVQRDIETLKRLASTVDVNTPGRDSMTLLQLALTSAEPRISDGSELPVVRALLALGAEADAGMDIACVRVDSELLEMLLAAGGDPNLKLAGQPFVFSVMSTITPRNFRLLAAKGLDLNSRSHGDPLPVQLVIYRRWDLLAVAIELGADTTLARADGRTVAGELASQIDEAKQAGGDIPAGLLQARAALEASRRKG